MTWMYAHLFRMGHTAAAVAAAMLSLQLLLLLSAGVSGDKILLLPYQFPSLIYQQSVLGHELVERGHEVYCLLGSRIPNQGRITGLGIHVVNFHQPDADMVVESDEYNALLGKHIFSNNDAGEMDTFETSRNDKDCEAIMQDSTMLQKVKEMNFDLAITATLPCHLVLPVYLGLPYVCMGADYPLWWTGVPAFPSFIPSFMTDRTDRVGLMDRLYNTIGFMYVHAPMLMTSPENNTHAFLAKYIPEIKDWTELHSRSLFHIDLMDHVLESPQTSLPNTVFLPGITLSPSNPLNAQFLEIVKSSPKGIILMSFGSTSAYLPDHILTSFFEAFRGLEQTVIWKMPRLPEQLRPQVPDNVKLLPWIPQNDLLGHPGTKVFVTHCGNNGQYEALFHGVPMLGFPIFLDQGHNCLRATKKGFGLQMDLKQFYIRGLGSEYIRAGAQR